MEDSKNKIFYLRSLGMSYRQIEKEVGCSKGTISYHLGEGQKQKSNKRKAVAQSTNKVYILKRKIVHFIENKTRNGYPGNSLSKVKKIIREKIRTFTKGNEMSKFTVEELLDKIGDHPVCYLTGEKIDLSQSSTYQLDHIIPRSLGGESTLENLGLCTSVVNRSKTDMIPEDFFALCKKVLEYNGYEVSPKCKSGANDARIRV